MVPKDDSSSQRRLPDPPTVHERDLKQVVQQQVKDKLEQSHGGTLIPKGRPYKEEFDVAQYPKGFVSSCCNISSNKALLFRFFISLSSMTFD